MIEGYDGNNTSLCDINTKEQPTQKNYMDPIELAILHILT